MSFVDTLNDLDSGGRRSPALDSFAQLLDPKSPEELEAMAARSVELTRRNFGRTMRLFAPVYLSNECVNNCRYCGFSRDNPILRTTLTVEQVVAEARHLVAEGFRSVLLVAGEHPRFVSEGYLEECLGALRGEVPSLALEVGPMERPEYERMVESGCESLVVYQETYHREKYRELHTSGPKKNFDWRLECPERGHDAGFRRLGIGALLGLVDWRHDALRLAAHLEYLGKRCWKSSLSVSLPRLRPAAGGYHPEFPVSDRDLTQLVCALRICFPQAGIVLSTREPAPLRDALFPLGITSASAGSHTEPGGYTGEGADDLHLTVRGRRVALEDAAEVGGVESGGNGCAKGKANGNGQPDRRSDCATGQFEIADERSPSEVAAHLRRLGLEPVWKDWDAAILS